MPSLDLRLNGMQEICDFLASFCDCHRRKSRRYAVVTLTFGNGQAVTFTTKEQFMATVRKDGGPLKMDVSAFIDDKGNPVTDKDPATYTSSNEAVATVVNDSDDPQDGIITLTGATTVEGETCVIKASFPAQRGGKPFEVVGNLVVIEPAAAGAQAVISGPGVIEGA